MTRFPLSQNDLLALRKIATKISKDVKRFWTKIDKVVAFTQKIESDEVRQKVRR
jgi:E1A-binding protein p400